MEVSNIFAFQKLFIPEVIYLLIDSIRLSPSCETQKIQIVMA